MKAHLDKIYGIIAQCQNAVEKLAADFKTKQYEIIFGISAANDKSEGEVNKSKLTRVLEHSLVPASSTLIANNHHNVTTDEQRSSRPLRVAKIKCGKNLKEPSLINKLRRPENEVTVTLEHEQSQSHMSITTEAAIVRSNSVSSTKTENAIVAVPEQPQTVIEIQFHEEQQTVQNENDQKEASLKSNENGNETGRLSVRVKRRKLSRSVEEQSQNQNESAQISYTPVDKLIPDKKRSTHSVTRSNSDESSKSRTKKAKKQKSVPKPIPIKRERISNMEGEISSPIATRTRKNSTLNKNVLLQSNETENSVSSDVIDVDAVDNLSNNQNLVNTCISPKVPNSMAQVANNKEIASSGNTNINGTVLLSSNGAINDATFCANAAPTTFQMVGPEETTYIVNEHHPNATVTLSKNLDAQGDATFQLSVETATNTVRVQENICITETTTYEKPLNLGTTNTTKTVKPPTIKALEMSTRIPVKTTTTGDKPSLHLLVPAPTLGRFLTPTQTANGTPSALVQIKKAHSSASKVNPRSKAISSIKKKPLSRAKSADEFRYGQKQLAVERKKQLEQKQMLAAQLRETKKNERTEKLAKLAREREVKRNEKQVAEQKLKFQLEKKAHKQRQEEQVAVELAKQIAKEKVNKDKEREMLKLHMRKQIANAINEMMPPPTQPDERYNFDMLQQDDSTDEDDKTTNKRPPPPQWSLANVRGTAILMQQQLSTDIIDSFFSVEPTTPDLSLIFPNIESRHLKRNSSAIWSTPPRYSELPKY